MNDFATFDAGERIVLLGVGMVARAVAARVAESCDVVGTTRSAARAADLEQRGVRPVVAPRLTPEIVSDLAGDSHVLVSFPPDGSTDADVAPACRNARSLVYVSSTGVYGSRRGRIDDETPVDASSDRARERLEAEASWREAGGVVLRAPGIYGPESGLHERVASGNYRLPGDGSGIISRIHVDDLASFILAAMKRAKPGETYVVGDATPVPQVEAVAWLAERLSVPMPEAAPLDEMHPSLRGSRAVDSSRARADLGVTLRYPSYREGFEAAIAAGKGR